MKCRKCAGYVGSVQWVDYTLWTNGMRITDEMLKFKCGDCREAIIRDMSAMLSKQAASMSISLAWSKAWDEYHGLT